LSDNWITHFLPDDLPQEVLPHTRAFFYNYDSYWYRDALEAQLWDLGERLLFHVSSEIQKCEKVSRLPSELDQMLFNVHHLSKSKHQESKRRLIFVAFSYGGLVIKQALVRAKSHEKHSAITKYTEESSSSARHIEVQMSLDGVRQWLNPCA
jgi:hypothetical protein